MAIGFGIVWSSEDWRTWTPGPSPYGDLIVNAENGPLVSVPAPGNGATQISIPNVPDFCIFRNGRLLSRDDGSGVDYAYDSSTEIATLAIGLRSGDIIQVNLALVMTIVLTETPSGTVNGSNTTFTTAHAPATDVAVFINGRPMLSGTDYSVSSSTITTVTFVPQTGDKLTVQYGY